VHHKSHLLPSLARLPFTNAFFCEKSRAVRTCRKQYFTAKPKASHFMSSSCSRKEGIHMTCWSCCTAGRRPHWFRQCANKNRVSRAKKLINLPVPPQRNSLVLPRTEWTKARLRRWCVGEGNTMQEFSFPVPLPWLRRLTYRLDLCLALTPPWTPPSLVAMVLFVTTYKTTHDRCPISEDIRAFLPWGRSKSLA